MKFHESIKKGFAKETKKDTGRILFKRLQEK